MKNKITNEHTVFRWGEHKHCKKLYYQVVCKFSSNTRLNLML